MTRGPGWRRLFRLSHTRPRVEGEVDDELRFHMEGRIDRYVRAGMPEEEALRAITINAAEIIGVDAWVGSLEVGKDADIVVFSGHPLDYRTVAELVLIDGQVAYQRET